MNRKLATVVLFVVGIMLVFSACPKDQEAEKPWEPPETGPLDPNFPEFERAAESLNPPYTITKNGLSVVFDPFWGMITQISNSTQTLNLDGILIDVGLRTEFVYDQVPYVDLDALETYTQPNPRIRNRALPVYVVTEIKNNTDNTLDVTLYSRGVFITYHYTFYTDALGVTCTIWHVDNDKREINGVAFFTRGLEFANRHSVTFEFPGNMPYGRNTLTGRNNVTSTLFSNALICFDDGVNSVNVIYVNEIEKWGTGVYLNSEETANALHLAAVLATVEPEEKTEVGNLLIQLPGSKDNKYAAAVNLYGRLGYHAPVNRSAISAGVMYEAHPAGTLDRGFIWNANNNPDVHFDVFAERLPGLRAMGIRNIWLMPVFHLSANHVYDILDHENVDSRHGGIAAARRYNQAAYDLGMRVIYDYVPHGPRTSQVQNTPNLLREWWADNRDGTHQVEWQSISIDYTHPGYADYMRNWAYIHASDWQVHGARIDCAMGGKPNWSATWAPAGRASQSGIAAGINISRVIMEGFIQGGKEFLNMPENFHPVPMYAKYTDIFYDMPLFRVITAMRGDLSRIGETGFVAELQHWLDAQRQTSLTPIHQRFLGNHDSVSWTLDQARPQMVWGTNRAKALWGLISFIDGTPMIYQGDEDPTFARRSGNSQNGALQGENLVEFFTRLFNARETYIGWEDDIQYQFLNIPVFSLTRTGATGVKRALINFSSNVQTVQGIAAGEVLFSENADFAAGTATLQGHGILLVR